MKIPQIEPGLLCRAYPPACGTEVECAISGDVHFDAAEHLSPEHGAPVGVMLHVQYHVKHSMLRWGLYEPYDDFDEDTQWA